MEQVARSYRSLDSGLAIVRPFTVIGEGQRDDMALSIWVDAIHNGDPITILGNLERRRDLTDVQRVVDGLVAAADRRYCGIVNLGAGNPRSLAEMVEAVFVAMGRGTPLLYAPARPEEVRVTHADTTRAQQDLGVELHTDLIDVTRRQVEYRLGVPAAH